MLEQVLSPLVVKTTPGHQEIKAIAADCVTRHRAHHYLGFAATQWKLLQKQDPPRVKPLLYVYRVLLTGIQLMRSGRVEANLPRLNEDFRLSCIPDLIDRKVNGIEMQTFVESKLPESPAGAAALNDLLIRLRLGATRC